MKRIYNIALILTILLFYSNFAASQQQIGAVEDFSILITFAQPPANPPIVKKAPLKYNKAFALILHMDDGNPAVHDQVMPFFKGQNGNPGLFFTEGNIQNNQPFKMDAVQFSFTATGVDVHNYVPGFLHWDNLINLWAGEFGIVNHGLTNPPQSNSELEVRRNASYTKRKTASGTIPGGYDMNVHVIPNNDISQIPFAKLHNLVVYHDGINSIQNPLRVESLPSITGIEVSRGSITNNLFQQVQTIANQCDEDNHFIASFFNHGFGGVDITFDQFKVQMNQIAAAYGRAGLNNIWSATSSEVFEYLRLKELITVNTEINENVLTITFSGNNIPDNFRYYALSIVVEGESNIVDMVVQQPNDFSSYLYSQNRALINMKWNGRAIPVIAELAESAVTAAEAQVTEANALVAMDYVQMLPDGDLKELLRDRLCALPGITYESGFCRKLDFLGPDTALCLNDSIIFIAPESASYLWSTGATARSITIVAEEPIEIWAHVTDNFGFVIGDTVNIAVLPLPEVMVVPDQATIDPDTEIQLEASGAQSYLWSNGSVEPIIIVSPVQTTLYSVTGTGLNGCKAVAEALVEVVYTTNIDFMYNDVCFGDTTILIVLIESNDSVVSIEWDLSGNGLFNDETGDTLRLIFNEVGEKLIGLRVKTQSGGLQTIYHSIVVADKPMASFEVSLPCLGKQTLFTDKSTVAIGSIADWRWSTGDGNLFGEKSFGYEYGLIGIYEIELIVASNYGCRDTVNSVLEIKPLPLIDLRLEDGTTVNNNQTITMPRGGTLTFKVNSPYDSIFWITTVITETFKVINEGNFYVDVFLDGCSDRRNFNVVETGDPVKPVVGILNLITPNGDGYNDVWLIQDLDKISPARVAVYTRSGAMVYQNNDYKNDWNGYYNGNPLPEGTYYYVIEGEGGTVYKGPLSILR
jgi:gliding motility-associated-like protein